jgi:hypothetical protein
MTAISYPDCRASSPNGRFTLEARSPHNGTIPHRNGRPASPDEFPFKYRDHQSEFRYRLLRGGRSRPVWERWQPATEDSPHEVVVSDDGWAVLRTHGFCPDVIAISPDGREVVRARIWYADNPDLRRGPPSTHVWRPATIDFTTAGVYWTSHSWRYFVPVAGRPHFVWRPWDGRRLVIDLDRAFVFPDDQPLLEGLERVLVEAERAGVTELLAGLAPRMTEIATRLGPGAGEPAEDDPLLEPLRQVKAALHLVGVHRVVECLPFLRAWEEIDCRSVSTGTAALPDHWLEVQNFRPILQHALRLMGEEPAGFAPYYFTHHARGRLPVPERLTDRRARAARLTPGMAPEQVLRLVGAPDHVRRDSHQVGRRYVWSETWDYDFRGRAHWLTVRVTWDEEPVRMTGLKQLPPDHLLTAGREAEILHW